MEVKSKRLTCPSCDGALLSTPESGRFKCANCKAEVNLAGGRAVATAPAVIEAVNRVQTGTDKVAAEMALRRLNDELAGLMYQRDQIALQYHQQQADGGAGAVVVAGIIVVACGLIGLFFLIAGATGFFLAWLVAGLVIGVIVLVTMTNSNARKSEALAESLKKQLAPVDRAIHQIHRKITEHRVVVEP